MFLVAGDLMLDILLLPSLQREEQPSGLMVRPGGSAANTAAWIAHRGGNCSFIGCVGRDWTGAMLCDELAAHGTGLRVRWVEGQETGSVAVNLTPEGERLMRSSRGANESLSPADIESAVAPNIDWVHLTGYGLIGPHRLDLLHAAGRLARTTGAVLSFDPSSVGVIEHVGRDTLVAALRTAGVRLLRANRTEARCLTGESDIAAAVTALADIVPIAVLTDGGHHVAWSDGHRRGSMTVQRSAPVDTTGAGDAFNAGLLVGLQSGHTLEAACSVAHEVARTVVGRYGGRPTVSPPD